MGELDNIRGEKGDESRQERGQDIGNE